MHLYFTTGSSKLEKMEMFHNWNESIQREKKKSKIIKSSKLFSSENKYKAFIEMNIDIHHNMWITMTTGSNCLLNEKKIFFFPSLCWRDVCDMRIVYYMAINFISIILYRLHEYEHDWGYRRTHTDTHIAERLSSNDR